MCKNLQLVGWGLPQTPIRDLPLDHTGGLPTPPVHVVPLAALSGNECPCAPAGMSKGACSPWKCWKAFFAANVTSETSVDEVSMHHFEKMSSASGGFAPCPHHGAAPGPRGAVITSRWFYDSSTGCPCPRVNEWPSRSPSWSSSVWLARHRSIWQTTVSLLPTLARADSDRPTQRCESSDVQITVSATGILRLLYQTTTPVHLRAASATFGEFKRLLKTHVRCLGPRRFVTLWRAPFKNHLTYLLTPRGKSTIRSFQWARDEHRTLSLSPPPPKGGSKMQSVRNLNNKLR